MSSDSAFIATTDRVLADIGRALDAALAAPDADGDWGIHEGILEVECADDSKVIVNRHLPNREIWVAARSGGFHFRAESGRWCDTRSGRTLEAVLGDVFAQQAGLPVQLPQLRAEAA